MQSSTLQSLTVTAIALAMSAGAQASGNHGHDRECSKATLRGLYVFSASGFNIVAGVAQPKAIVEFIRFDGDGTLTVPAATASINGEITRTGGSEPAGNYSVAANCTGVLSFGPPGPTFDLFLAPRGSEVYMIQTGGGVPGLGPVPGVMQGIAERLSADRTRADDSANHAQN